MTKGEAMYSILSNDAGIIAVVPVAQIVPVNAPMNTPNPMIVYSTSSTTADHDKTDGKTGQILYEIDIFSSTFTQAQEIADLVRTALDLYVGSFTGFEFNRIRFEGEDDRAFDPENNVYQISQGYNVRIKYD